MDQVETLKGREIERGEEGVWCVGFELYCIYSRVIPYFQHFSFYQFSSYVLYCRVGGVLIGDTTQMAYDNTHLKETLRPWNRSNQRT